MTNLLEVVNSGIQPLQEKNFKTGFKGLSQINKAKNLGFIGIDKNQIQAWVDENVNDNYSFDVYELCDKVNINPDVLSHGFIHRIPKNILDSVADLLGAEYIVHDNIMGLLSANLRHTYKKEKDASLIASTIVQDGLDVFEIGIKETPVEEYAGIPPAHIVMYENKVSDMNIFDKISVLEPNKQDFKFKEKIKDPILVGKFDLYPDLYFIIGVWDKDIAINTFIKEGTKALIEETTKFFQDFEEYKKIGENLLGLNQNNLLDNNI